MITLPQWMGRVWYALTRPNDPAGIRYIPVPVRHAGVYVDHDVALKISAFFRGVAYISQTVAGMPWDVIRETESRTIKMPNHPLWRILHTSANDEIGSYSFKETLIAWAISWGNGYAEIEWDEGGRPYALHPVSPDRVEVKRDRETDRLYYHVSNYTGEATDLEPQDMFHLHGLGFDGVQGYSVVSLAARSMGLSIAAEEYASDFFANGAVSTGAFVHEGHLKQDSYDRLKANLIEKYSRVGERFKPWILEDGMEWKTMSMPSKDAQMLETREFQVTDIARWLGLPPHKLMDLTRATFSNIEQQSIEVVNDALMPWVYRLEQEANRKLIAPRERGVRTKLNVRGLLRGDDQSRANYYLIMRNIGVYTTNDIRRLEDMDPIGPEGDELLVQLNQTTLKRLVEGEPQKPEPGPMPDTERTRQSYALLVEDAYRRILRRESNRFEQNRHKFSQPGVFDAWIREFSAQQREYMRIALNPLLTSMVMLCAPSSVGVVGATRVILDAAIDAHMESTCEELRQMNAGQLDAMTVEIRAKQEAKDLIERVFASITVGVAA